MGKIRNVILNEYGSSEDGRFWGYGIEIDNKVQGGKYYKTKAEAEKAAATLAKKRGRESFYDATTNREIKVIRPYKPGVVSRMKSRFGRITPKRPRIGR